MLLKYIAKIVEKDNDGYPALLEAAVSGHKAVVELLLNNGVLIHRDDEDDFTALHGVAKSEHEAVVHLLLECGPNINEKDKNEYTAPPWAA